MTTRCHSGCAGTNIEQFSQTAWWRDLSGSVWAQFLDYQLVQENLPSSLVLDAI